MTQSALTKFSEGIRHIWRPLGTEIIEKSQRFLTELVQTRDHDPRLIDLLQRKPETEELYKDPTWGFMLLAHTEKEGRYRIPHDHGSGWVIYAVLHGEVEMRTYKNITGSKGVSQLVRRESYRMKPGDCRVFLPGDIHDTLCISESVTMLRFSSCDLKKEDSEGRMVRYVDFKS